MLFETFASEFSELKLLVFVFALVPRVNPIVGVAVEGIAGPPILSVGFISSQFWNVFDLHDTISNY
jgi:hypothetical protein